MWNVAQLFFKTDSSAADQLIFSSLINTTKKINNERLLRPPKNKHKTEFISMLNI